MPDARGEPRRHINQEEAQPVNGVVVNERDEGFERHDCDDRDLLEWDLLTHRTCVLLAQHEKSAIAAEDVVARKLARLEHVVGVADETPVSLRSCRMLE